VRLQAGAAQSGATLMLAKPFGSDQLTALVQRCLAEAANR